MPVDAGVVGTEVGVGTLGLAEVGDAFVGVGDGLAEVGDALVGVGDGLADVGADVGAGEAKKSKSQSQQQAVSVSSPIEHVVLNVLLVSKRLHTVAPVAAERHAAPCGDEHQPQPGAAAVHDAHVLYG